MRTASSRAPAPAHIIEGGIPTEALLAQIAVSKADGLPLYQQEAIYARDKVELDRKLMAQSSVDLTTLPTSRGPGSALCSGRCRSLIDATTGHQSPSGARQFIRQRYRDKLRRLLQKHSC
ncbi:hypothetical protein J2Z31_002825 [Sinorhizobium kostiense]|uniref:Transposase IS66 central domain-containing protein n=1 Tax=Sinorhizobium kostiense TaxID=76747 RepID=A0ABS4R0A0_9HYPH|nr:hypothetical protein [Sinorhizobium kostiense]